jgi:2-polyprenyl-6-methoxyphenol hydroxylase-like FAD-dependent oxidoreductase
MAEGAAMALDDGLVLADCLTSERGIAQAVASFQGRRPRTQWVRAQTHRQDRARNLPPLTRNLVLRQWGRNLFHANYRPLLDLRPGVLRAHVEPDPAVRLPAQGVRTGAGEQPERLLRGAKPQSGS